MPNVTYVPLLRAYKQYLTSAKHAGRSDYDLARPSGLGLNDRRRSRGGPNRKGND